MRGWPEPAQRHGVRRGRIAEIGVPAVAGMAQRQRPHDPVAGDLGDDGSGGVPGGGIATAGAGGSPPVGADDGNGAPGRGLLGLRERLALYGGELTAGPQPGGGWQVRAVMPAGTAS